MQRISIKTKELIKNSIFYSKIYYRNSYSSDLGNIDYLDHFLNIGWRRGKNPSENFDTVYYLSKYKDIFNFENGNLLNPFVHFILHGLQEGRYPTELFGETYIAIKESGFFDKEFYLRENKDIARDNFDPLSHFLHYGWKEGRNPSSEFDINEYLYKNPEVRSNKENPLLHYLLASQKEDIKDIKTVRKTLRLNSNLVEIDKAEIYSAYSKYEELSTYEAEEFPIIPETTLKFIAFYLPQFYPFEENNRFWGKGFTEWTNTTKAKPLFKGHYQPRLPGELGFYDTRLKQVLIRQVELAKQYGIYGFCFHHYFFDGKPFMRTPYNHILNNKDLDIKFCLHWANEPWTARWDGLANKGGVLMPQNHNAKDDIAFFEDIKPALMDERYIRINNRPLLLIYRPGLFPNIKETIVRWRECAQKAGLGELFLAVIQTGFEPPSDPTKVGFDAAIEYPPHHVLKRKPTCTAETFDENFQGEFYDYDYTINEALKKKKPNYKLFRGVIPDWDVTPRRRNPSIVLGSTPAKFQNWLEGIGRYTLQNLDAPERFIFLNAWNEWAEGAYLEPDRKFGYAYLNAVSRGLINIAMEEYNSKKKKLIYSTSDSIKKTKIAVVLHLFYEDLKEEIGEYLHNITDPFDLFISCRVNYAEDVKYYFEKSLPNTNIEIRQVSNIGFDVMPFIVFFSKKLENYEYICKIHSKKSLHWEDSNVWRRYLYDHLLGSRERVNNIIKSLKRDENLGIVYADHFPSLVNFVGWDDNFSKAKLIADKLDFELTKDQHFDFPSGTMFWFKPKALKSLFDINLGQNDFDKINNRTGTLSHAIERMILTIARNNGYTWMKTSPMSIKDDLNYASLRERLFKTKNKIAICLHLYYTDLIDEFVFYFKNIKVKFDLLITTIPEKIEYVKKYFKAHFPNILITVKGASNIGYDVFPFLVEYSHSISQYDLVCKIHSKKSNYNSDFSFWRKFLLDNLLGSIEVINKILNNFYEDDKLGIIYPEHFPPIKKHVEWGSNYNLANDLIKKMGLNIQLPSNIEYPSGTMFWFRPEALKPLFDINLTYEDCFENSEVFRDGSTAHAIERLPLVIAQSEGFKAKKVLFYEYNKTYSMP